VKAKNRIARSRRKRNGIGDGAELAQSSDPLDASDGGEANSRVVAQFTFGDPSESHSEKYRLLVTPASGTGETPRPFAFVNAEYGECETVSAPLMPGWEYAVRLEHDSSNLSVPDYDYSLSCAAPSRVVTSDAGGLFGENSNSGESFEAAGKVAKLYVLGMPKLVPDFDRDGDIDEDDEAEADAGRTFRFWINDDQDSGDVNENASNDVSGWLGD